MIRLGLCSGACITRDVPGVISTALGAKLDAVEWAADVHVALGDLRSAEETLIATLSAGLTIGSFSSIYRAGCEDEGLKRFDTILATVAVMQAPLLRIYAGTPGHEVPRLASELKAMGDKAAQKGITILLSFGRKTYLDGYDKAERLLEAARHDFVKLAWEDLPGTKPAEATAALRGFGRRAAAMFALSTGRDGRPRPLAAEAEAWRERLAAFKLAEKEPKMGSFVFLEAPRADGPEGEAALAADARVIVDIADEIDPTRKKV